MNCSRRQRRRARATSGRCCSAACRLFFFEGEIMSSKKPPDRGAATRNAPLAHRGDDLVQHQIRLLGNHSQQPLRVLLQRRRAASARLCFGASCVTPALQPFHRGTRAQIEALSGLSPRRSRFDCLDHAFPQIIGIWLRHRLGPPKDESMLPDSPIDTPLGIPTIQPSRNML
jgi:hypothetical protein